jgi:phosphoglycerate kinase
MYRYISNEPVAGKTLLVRVDLNANFQNGTLKPSERISAHAAALDTLSQKGARSVVLAHQGRKGDPDYFPLAQHAQILAKLLHRPVPLLEWDSDYPARIRQMSDGDIVLMQNVREFDAESKDLAAAEHAKLPFVRALAATADAFVLDALSVAHRSQASVVGFSALLPSFAGPMLEKELSALSRLGDLKTGRLLVMGGAKPADSLIILSHLLDNRHADRAVCGGVLGEVLLKARGVSLGNKDYFLQEKGYLKLLPQAKKLLAAHREKIVLPADLAFADPHKKRREIALSALPVSNPTLDIGPKTIALFSKEIRKAQLCVCNGTMGVFEQPEFALGTKKIFSALSKTKGFSLLGGGDTLTALTQLKFKPAQFGHVSLAGKALQCPS